MKGAYGKAITAFVFDLCMGLLFTILLTAPAVRFLDTHVVGYPLDGFEYVWKMWWMRRSLLDLHISPARLAYVDYPYTAGSNPHLLASPLLGLLALPVESWLGPLQTYNAILLSSLALSWPTGALLCYAFTRDRSAASVGGALYAFSAHRMAHAVGGHLPQATTFLFPIMALLMWRTWRTRRLRTALWAGLVLGLSVLVDLKHVALFIAPFVVLFLGFWAWTERRSLGWARVRASGAALGVGALVAGPFFVPLVLDRFQGKIEFFYMSTGTVRHAADLLGFVIPSPEHPLYSRWPAVYALSQRLAEPGWHENVFYLGWVAIPLAVIGVWRHWRERSTRFWLLLVLVSMVLALGPVLKVGEQVVTWQLGGRTGTIPLPYALLQGLPFYDWCRTPGRMFTLTMMGWSVLVALGAGAVTSRLHSGGLQMAAGLLLIALVVGDQVYTWPMPLGDAQVPAFYEHLAEDPADFAVLDLPLWEGRCERYQIYYATIHGHRIVGGMITRRSSEAVAEMRRVEKMAVPGSGIDAARALGAEGIRYVVLNKQCLDEEGLGQYSAHLADRLGPSVYDDTRIRAYEVPGKPTVPMALREGT